MDVHFWYPGDVMNEASLEAIMVLGGRGRVRCTVCWDGGRLR